MRKNIQKVMVQIYHIILIDKKKVDVNQENVNQRKIERIEKIEHLGENNGYFQEELFIGGSHITHLHFYTDEDLKWYKSQLCKSVKKKKISKNKYI